MISVNLNRQSNRFLHGPPPETMFLPTLKEQDMKKLLIGSVAASLTDSLECSLLIARMEIPDQDLAVNTAPTPA